MNTFIMMVAIVGRVITLHTSNKQVDFAKVKEEIQKMKLGKYVTDGRLSEVQSSLPNNPRYVSIALSEIPEGKIPIVESFEKINKNTVSLGNIIVDGDIKGNCHVEAAGNILVFGKITGGAIVEAGGNILVMDVIVDAEVFSYGSIDARKVLPESTVVARLDVKVGVADGRSNELKGVTIQAAAPPAIFKELRKIAEEKYRISREQPLRPDDKRRGGKRNK